MSNIEKTCGTCRFWRAGEKAQIGSLLTRKQDPWCIVWKTVKYEEDKPVSWCWKPMKGDKACESAR